MGGRVCYLATPIDNARSSNQERFDRHRVCELLNNAGFTVFDPRAGWRSVKDGDGFYPTAIRTVDQAATDAADCLLALWPAGVLTTGVPMEVERMLNQNKPVAVVGEQHSVFLIDRPGVSVFRKGSEVKAVEWLDRTVAHWMPGELTVGLSQDIDLAGGDAWGDGWAAEGGAQLYPEGDAPLTVGGLQQRVREFQEAKDWLHDGRTFGDDIALIHTELSEALEEFRNGKPPNGSWHDGSTGKPVGVPSEFADTIIRILGACNEWGIDLEEALRIKLDYNDTRESRHGGKLL
jgi:hypothetical protein